MFAAAILILLFFMLTNYF